MKEKSIVMPTFVNEAQEADWWASREGREFVKQKSAETGKKAGVPKGSCLLGRAKGHRIPGPPQDAGA